MPKCGSSLNWAALVPMTLFAFVGLFDVVFSGQIFNWPELAVRKATMIGGLENTPNF